MFFSLQLQSLCLFVANIACWHAVTSCKSLIKHCQGADIRPADFCTFQAKDKYHERNVAMSLVSSLKRWTFVAVWDRFKNGRRYSLVNDSLQIKCQKFGMTHNVTAAATYVNEPTNGNAVWNDTLFSVTTLTCRRFAACNGGKRCFKKIARSRGQPCWVKSEGFVHAQLEFLFFASCSRAPVWTDCWWRFILAYRFMSIHARHRPWFSLCLHLQSSHSKLHVVPECIRF